MPAPSLEALFDFETQFEKATLFILADSGIAAFLTGYEGTLPLIHTSVSFDVGAANGDLTFLPLGSDAPQARRQEYFKYAGDLAIEVSVERDTARQATAPGVDTFQGQCRGRIRSVFLRSLWPFHDGNLPFLRVTDLRPNGTSIGFVQARNVDTIVLRYAVTFAIQPSAWPVGFPS